MVTNACLSISDYPRKMDFDAASVFGGVYAPDHIPSKQNQRNRNAVSKQKGRLHYKTQCLPFYSLILAAGNPTIDYLSLDIEGSEIQVSYLILSMSPKQLVLPNSNCSLVMEAKLEV